MGILFVALQTEDNNQLQETVFLLPIAQMGFPGESVGKNPPANAGDSGSVPGLGRSPGEISSNPLQYSSLGDPMGRGAWRLQSLGSQKFEHDSVTEQQHTEGYRNTWRN